MRIERTVTLPVGVDVALQGLVGIHGKELANFAADATSSGEALLERSGLARLDAANQCHFGAQLGHPVSHDSKRGLQLRWWNDRSRSLTPGFIGELVLGRLSDQTCELTLAGDYHPRAHLYELVDRAFLSRMAQAVAAAFLEAIRAHVLEVIVVNAA
jgi:hypothetical protein